MKQKVWQALLHNFHTNIYIAMWILCRKLNWINILSSNFTHNENSCVSYQQMSSLGCNWLKDIDIRSRFWMKFGYLQTFLCFSFHHFHNQMKPIIFLNEEANFIQLEHYWVKERFCFTSGTGYLQDMILALWYRIDWFFNNKIQWEVLHRQS